MTTALFDLRSLALTFLLAALAALTLTTSRITLPIAQQDTPKRVIVLAASEETQEIHIFISDDPDNYPASDCGHNISLHLVRFIADDKEDHCTLGWMSRDEFVRRIVEWMNRHGTTIDFPNGITDDALKVLARNPAFVEGAKVVLTEFARAHGFDAPPPTFLGPFPFDAFLGP